MTLIEMFDLIKFIANKDFAGQVITPERYKQLLPLVNIEHFRDKYGLPEQYQPGRPVPLEQIDITLKNTDDMKAFKVYLPNRAVNNGVMLYPADYVHYQAISYNYTKTLNGVATSLPRPVEVLREAEFSARQGNYTKRPTASTPIGIIRSDGIHIRPISITSCDFSYLRYPRTPVFSYTLGDGFVTYLPASSVELEWPEDEKIVIMRRILEYIGINLREEALLGYANAKLKEG